MERLIRQGCVDILIDDLVPCLVRPVFLDLDNLPKGYNDDVNPYANPPRSTVDLRAMFRYAAEHGKKMIELTRDEVKQFEI